MQYFDIAATISININHIVIPQPTISIKTIVHKVFMVSSMEESIKLSGHTWSIWFTAM